jgi:hypothetical protein
MGGGHRCKYRDGGGRNYFHDTVAGIIRRVRDGNGKIYPELKWNNTYFVLVGLAKGLRFNFIHDCHWVFFKGDEVFYRVTLMHNFSDLFPPALVAEVTQKEGLCAKSKEEIGDLVVQDLLRLGIVASAKEIARTDIKLVEYTYAIPTLGARRG